MKPINLKFCAPVKIIYRNGRNPLILNNRFFDFSLLYPRKNGLRRKSKVSPMDTRIKYSGLRISHSKAFSSDKLVLLILVNRIKSNEATRSQWNDIYFGEKNSVGAVEPAVEI